MHVPMSTSVIRPPQAVPSNAPRDTVCLVADGALRCPTAKASWRNRAIVKIILGQHTGQKPKLVLFEIAWLPSFYHLACLGETLLVRRPIQMMNNHDILYQEECKGEMELCKALDTWIYIMWTNVMGREIQLPCSSSSPDLADVWGLCLHSAKFLHHPKDLLTGKKGLLLWERTSRWVADTKPSAEVQAKSSELAESRYASQSI